MPLLGAAAILSVVTGCKTATITPAPSAAPFAQADALHRKLTALTTMNGSVEGMITLGSKKRVLGGSIAIGSGGQKTSITELGATDVTAITFDSVIAGGARYVKIAGGPWVNHGTPGAGTDLLTLLDSFPSTTDLGTTTRGTLQLHQISAPMNGFDAATALGFETANWRGEDGTFRVWATDDGTPKGIGASIHWTQALDGVRTECSMDIDAMFADAGAASISAPSGAWAWSTETPLAFALPPGFSKKSSDSSGILYHSGTSTLLAVTDVAFASLDQLSKRAWGDVAADSEYDCYVAGEAARCMVKSGSKSGVFMRLYAFTRGPAFYAIGVAGAYTQQGELEGLMDQILPTIELPN